MIDGRAFVNRGRNRISRGFEEHSCFRRLPQASAVGAWRGELRSRLE